MTVTTETASITHTGNGSTTVFSVPFKFISGDHLRVTRIVIATGIASVVAPGNYTVSGAGDPSGGTVTYLFGGVALTSLYKLKIERIVPYTQDLDIDRQGGFFPETIEEQLDLLTMQIQQLKTAIEDAVSDGTITSITGAVSGPGASTVDDFATWNNTTGTLLKNSGYNVSTFALAVHSHSFASLSGKPTTLSGYGITDAEETAVDAAAAALLAGTHTNISVSYDDAAGTISLIAAENDWIVKKRTANSSITSTTVLATDTELQFTMEAGATYVIEADLWMLSPAAVGIKVANTGPAAPTLVASLYKDNDSGGGTTVDWRTSYGSHKANTPGANQTIKATIEMRVVNGASAGVFGLQFAQNVSSATATVIYSGSQLRYRKV